MSHEENLRAEISELHEQVYAAAYAVGMLRVLSTTEAGVWSETERLRRVHEQTERLAEAIGVNDWPDASGPATDSSPAPDSSPEAGGGDRR